MSEARELLVSAMRSLGLTVTSEFVPWSASRSFVANSPIGRRTLNWKVTLHKDGRAVLTTDYSAGIAHAPSYRPGSITIDLATALASETEHGRVSINGRHGSEINPDSCDVMYSLMSDASAIDHASFASWASEFGLDEDSRKAEACYRACLEIGLKLHAALGDSGIASLRDACRDF